MLNISCKLKFKSKVELKINKLTSELERKYLLSIEAPDHVLLKTYSLTKALFFEKENEMWRSLVFTFTKVGYSPENSPQKTLQMLILLQRLCDMATQLPVPRVPRKIHFSRREINEAAVFENHLKEHLFFSKFKHAFCKKPKNKKIIAKRVVKEAHFSSSLFYFFS